jgi:hypothetical protein
MEGLPKMNQENKVEKSKIKEGVNFVFEKNPELLQIGSKEKYSEYLDSIFPESKVKGIVYHQTDRTFDEFNLDKSKSGGVYFSPYNRPVHKFINFIFTGKYRSETKSVLINIKNPFFAKESKYEVGVTNINKLQKKIDISNYDGVIGYSNHIYYKGEFDKGYIDIEKDKSNAELVVFESEQIHMLGSKQDIEGFKKFVENNQVSQS